MKLARVVAMSLLVTSCTKPAPLQLEAAPKLTALPRGEFNFRAQERFLPLFWRADDDHDGAIDPDELSVLWGPQHATRADYVEGQSWRPAFMAAYKMMQADIVDPSVETERERRELVRKELRGGLPTLVETDLSGITAEERAMLAHVFAAAVELEKIYARQKGVLGMAAKIPYDDPASRALFHRNQQPWCVTPQLEKNAACSAVPTLVPHRSGMYPLDVQADAKFCETLAAEPNGKALMDHYAVVRKGASGYVPVGYDKAFPTEMQAVAVELDEAASSITSTGEQPLKAYLAAAAQAFRTNEWEPANEAWLAMSGSTSKWYLRVAPDETYYEPCAQKAGFAIAFARMNPASKEWRDKLEPVKAEMEGALATLAGPPYKARDVAFKLPDFIDIVLNAGDQRYAHGATLGESLPNWGPVADKGGRTVAMTNLYTDADSREQLKQQMASLFCAATNEKASTDAKASTMSTVLHEAAHNLGPAHDYAVGGKKDANVFGGPLASMMEELKAQTSALYFSEWLVGRSLLGRDDADRAHVRDVAWAFGHIAQGMYEGDGKPKTYSQLASIQLGSLWEAGALVWKGADKAANATDDGCFEIDLVKWKPAVDALAKRVLGDKSRGDKKDAEAMKASFVDLTQESAEGAMAKAGVIALKGGGLELGWAKAKKTIEERWLRAPKQTFVYGVR